MASKLYTFPKNPRAFKIQIAAKYSGANLEVVSNFKLGETNKTAEFKANFPFQKVPALLTPEGHPIYESNAIAQYSEFTFCLFLVGLMRYLRYSIRCSF